MWEECHREPKDAAASNGPAAPQGVAASNGPARPRTRLSQLRHMTSDAR